MKYLLKKLIGKTISLIFGKNYAFEYYHKKAIKLLHNEGNNALKAIIEIGDEKNIIFDLSFGTLLGAFREHGFIVHDDDLDFTLDIKFLSIELISLLRNKGFIIDSLFVSSDLHGCQLPMKYNGLTCDIYFLYLEEDGRYHTYVPHPIEEMNWEFSAKTNLYRCRDIAIPYYNKRISCEFNDYNVSIPINTKEILSQIYGRDFMTPKRGVITVVDKIPLYNKFFNRYPIKLCIDEGIIEQIQNINNKNV